LIYTFAYTPKNICLLGHTSKCMNVIALDTHFKASLVYFNEI